MATNSGYIPDSFDARDKAYHYRGTSKSKKDFKKGSLLDSFKSLPTYDQDSTKSSTANALAAAVRYLSNKCPDLKIPSDPSRLFIYYNSRALPILEAKESPTQWPPHVTDNGATIRDSIRSIDRFGVTLNDDDQWIVEGCGNDQVTLDVNSYPPDDAYKLATQIASLEYCRLDPEHTPEAAAILEDNEKCAIKVLTLARLKQCLVEGFPVVFAFRFYFQTLQSHLCKAKAPDDLCYPTLKDIPHSRVDQGAHVILAVAFDTCTHRVLVQNSQGRDNPFFWIPFSWILDYEATKDFWVLRPVDASQVAVLSREVPQATEAELLTNWSRNHPGTDQGRALSMTPASCVTSASRAPGTVDMFWITNKGAIENACYADGKWTTKVLVDSESKEAPAPGPITGAITVATRDPDWLEVFWISRDGKVQSAYKIKDEWSQPFQLGTAVGNPGAGIASVVRFKGHTEVWWVGPKGSIESAYYNPEEGDKKSEWKYYQLAGDGSAAPFSSVAALSMNRNNATVFWVTPKGAIDGRIWWDDKDGWRPQLYSEGMLASENSASLQTRITAVSRKGLVMDIFYISRKGEVCHQVWTKQSSWAHGQGYQLFPEFSARVDSGLTVVNARDDRMDLFWVSPENALMGSTWTNGGDWVNSVIAKPGGVMGRSPLGTIARDSNSFAVVFRACDGQLTTAEYVLPALPVVPSGGDPPSGNPPPDNPGPCCCKCIACGCA